MFVGAIAKLKRPVNNDRVMTHTDKAAELCQDPDYECVVLEVLEPIAIEIGTNHTRTKTYPRGFIVQWKDHQIVCLESELEFGDVRGSARKPTPTPNQSATSVSED